MYRHVLKPSQFLQIHPFRLSMLYLFSPGRVVGKSLVVWCVAWMALPLHLPLLNANPSGSSVQSGSASVTSGPGTVQVNQTSQRAVIHWNDFSIRQGETTTFVQPNAKSATLNRVTGSSVSRLDGNLNANGQVYLVNKNGVVIGKTGRINAASFTASTHDVDNAEFIRGGDLNYRGNSTAKVINYGKIKATDGDVTLIARRVENHGTISAKNGRAQMAAGTEVLIKSDGAERVFIKPGSAGAPGETGIINTGKVRSAVAELKAAGGNEYALAINNTGTIRATGSRTEGGRVYLTSTGGRIQNSGTIRAVNPDGSGGQIRVTGGDIVLKNGSKLDASGSRKRGGKGGTVLVGGDWQGSGSMEQARSVKMETGATITADATASPTGIVPADGGKVVLWSTGLTDFGGSITARGIGGGAGGKVETSGHDLAVDKAALVLTEGGEWLLDPLTLTVVSTAAPGTIDGTGQNDVSNTTISAQTIVNALNNGNVTLLATNSITVDAAIDASGNTNAYGLTFNKSTQLLGNLYLNAPITLKAGAVLAGYVNTITVGINGKIQNAVDAIKTPTTAGGAVGTINLAAGTYYENLRINKGMNIVGQGAGVTILNGSLADSVVIITSGGIVNAVAMNNLTITNGRALNGGGVRIAGLPVTMTGSELYGNYADLPGDSNGGAIAVNGVNVTLTNSNVHDNVGTDGAGDDRGGAISQLSAGGSIILRRTAVYNNSSISGGGLYVLGSSTFESATVANNTASNNGGGVVVAGGTSTWTNSTIANNRAANNGGGALVSNGTSNWNSLTVAGNSATRGGGLYRSNGVVNITNTVVATNIATTGTDMFGASAINDNGYNFFGNIGNVTLTNNPITTIKPTNTTDILDPLLSPLGYYGGLTPTMAILAGSPLLNKGNQALTGTVNGIDSRGQTRVTGTIDIGAYDANQAAPMIDFVVRNTGDYAPTNTPTVPFATMLNTLRAALTFAEAPSTVTFAMPTGIPGYSGGIWTITMAAGNTTFPIRRATVIDGTTQSASTTPVIVVNGNALGSVFTVGAGAGNAVTLKTLSITGGRATNGAGINISGSNGTVRLDNVQLYSNTATGYGGGIYFSSTGGRLELNQVSANSNTAGQGGGLFDTLAGGAQVVVTSSHFNQNTASTGGGVFNSVSSGSSVDFGSSEVNQNQANVGAGFRNEADGATSLITIHDSYIYLNTASVQGGGMSNQLSNNGTLTEDKLYVLSNTATSDAGGAQYSNLVQGTLNITNSTFNQNTAGAVGGALYNDLNGTSTLTIGNSTFAGNSGTAGGAIANSGVAGTTLTLSSSTLAGNTSRFEVGGAIYLFNGSISINNSIIANSAGSGPDVGGSGTYVDGGHNLVRTVGSVSTFTSPTTLTNVDPLLAPLNLYGGTVRPTFALLPGSPAINAGSSTYTVDQRGLGRVGTADIGSFESQGFTYSVFGGSGQSTVIGTAFTNPLIVQVTANNAVEPVTGGIVGLTIPNASTMPSITGTLTQTVNASGRASFSVNANSLAGSYSVNVTGAPGTSFALTNDRATITVLPDSGLGKIYGEANPTLTYTISNGTLIAGPLSGSLDYGSGTNVGNYNYTLGTLANSNYILVLDSAAIAAVPGGLASVYFQIDQRPITITPNSGQSKIYGEADPSLTYSVGGAYGFVPGDNLSGSLAYNGGSGAGSHAFNLGTLSNPNYAISLAGAVTFQIDQRPITITPNSGQSKLYGSADPTFTYSVGGAYGLVPGDDLTGALSYSGGQDAGAHSFTLGTLGNPNYALTLAGGITFQINVRNVLINPNFGQSKVYGQADPLFTYTVGGDAIVPGDDLAGNLSRVAGQNVGTYAYTLGTLAISPNYVLSIVPGNTFEITRAMLTVQATNANGIAGQPLPMLGGVVTGFVNGDDSLVVTGLTYTTPATSASPSGLYSINPGGASAFNYNFTYLPGVLTLAGGGIPPVVPPVDPPVIPPMEPPVVIPDPTNPNRPAITFQDLAEFNATWGRNNIPVRRHWRGFSATQRAQVNYSGANIPASGMFHMSSYNVFGGGGEISVRSGNGGR
ncbi:MAG: MBG domain-containing protein [Candidatus Methylacidiphilales bacterium]